MQIAMICIYSIIDKDSCIIASSTTCRIGSDKVKEPDGSIKPYDRKTKGPFSNRKHEEFPTVIIEVEHTNKTLTQLKQELDDWLTDTTTVIIAIGLKIGERIKRNGEFSLTFIMKIRDNNDFCEIELDKCTDYGNPHFQVKIPIKFIFDRGMLPKHLESTENIVLDLFALKRLMLQILGPKGQIATDENFKRIINESYAYNFV